jgi:heme/copper-type cytochrome/quinol oxidase subunit 2
MPHNFLPTAWPAAAIFWAATLLCAVAHLGILRSVLRSRNRGAMEIAWAVLPAIALAAVLVMTWRTMHASV